MKLRLTIVIGLLALILVPLAAQESTTVHQGDYFITEGKVDATDWYDKGMAAIADYAHFNQWALKGMDGKDPVSATFWEKFIDFVYEAPNHMTLVYDIDLGWPLGSKGNRSRFKIDDSKLAQGTLKVVMEQKPFGFADAQLVLSTIVDPATKKKYVNFRVAISYYHILDVLLDANMKGYSEHMNYVVFHLADNLREYCQTIQN